MAPPSNKPISGTSSSASRSPRRPASTELLEGSPVPQIPPHPAAAASNATATASNIPPSVDGSPRRASQQFLSPSPATPRPSNSNSASGLSLTLPSAPESPASTGADKPLTDAQKAEVIRKHLLSADEQQRVAADQALQSGFSLGTSPARRSGFPQPARSATGTAESEPDNQSEFPTPYHLEGGDVVAGVYKWAAQQADATGASTGGEGANTPNLRRSRSLVSIPGEAGSRRTSHVGGEANRVAFRADLARDADEAPGEFSTAEMLQPGGFRRDFVYRKTMAERDSNSNLGGAAAAAAADESGISSPGSLADYQVVRQRRAGGPATRSFIDFLSLYGHFGGEDLEEIEEDQESFDEEDRIEGGGAVSSYDAQGGRPKVATEASARQASERTPLIRGRSTRGSAFADSRATSKKRASSVGQHGDATVTQAVMMLLKSFVGTGVLFLGKAFYNGGILFSTIVLCFIAMISLYSFLLLVETRLVVPHSFGDIGGVLYGKYMRWAILFSIVLSQIGFVAAYTIFVSQNLQAFFMAVTNCRTYISIPYLIMAQLVIFLPLAMIRNIQKLSGTALVADAFILFGLIYIFSNEISVLADHGIAKVALFNSKDFPLLIGTAVFAFEGIGLIIPITESMKHPHKFPKVLTGVMVGVMILFAGAGVLAYLTYGSDIQTVVFVNLPQDDKLVNAAQFLYSIAILLSTPLQLFPAVRIMENGIFSRSGKHSPRVKWEKNTFRMAVVVGCAVIAWAGASDLDKFVSLIGSLACVPLCFCYPAMLHYKACAHTRKQKVADIALFVFGLVAAIYTTSQTITLLATGGESAPPTFGKCPPRS
ncbi:hypothetical protein JCM21900_002327 [Sporobolomyces salmonicolor]